MTPDRMSELDALMAKVRERMIAEAGQRMGPEMVLAQMEATKDTPPRIVQTQGCWTAMGHPPWRFAIQAPTPEAAQQAWARFVFKLFPGIK